MVTDSIMRDRKNYIYMILTQLTDFTVLETFKKRTLFKLINVGLTKEGIHKWQKNGFTYIYTLTHMYRCKTNIYRYKFELHDRITIKMIIRFC